MWGTIRLVLAGLGLVCAVAAIVSDVRGRMPEARAFRPAVMVLALAVAALGPSTYPSYKLYVLLGLALALAGDILMMLPKKRFVEGMAAFVAGNILFCQAFRDSPPRVVSYGTLIPLVLLGLLAYFMLGRNLGPLRFPVFVYIAALVVMVWLASDRFVETGGTGSALAFAGAVLFLVSDAVLAFNRFNRPIAGAQPIILGTFYPAMLLIALSA